MILHGTVEKDESAQVVNHPSEDVAAEELESCRGAHDETIPEQRVFEGFLVLPLCCFSIINQVQCFQCTLVMSSARSSIFSFPVSCAPLFLEGCLSISWCLKYLNRSESKPDATEKDSNDCLLLCPAAGCNHDGRRLPAQACLVEGGAALHW